MFFVISPDPPIKQGQTRYHFLILLFSKDEDFSLMLSMNEEEVEKPEVRDGHWGVRERDGGGLFPWRKPHLRARKQEAWGRMQL